MSLLIFNSKYSEYKFEILTYDDDKALFSVRIINPVFRSGNRKGCYFITNKKEVIEIAERYNEREHVPLSYQEKLTLFSDLTLENSDT
tara:strand:- start:1100 stop:1363 length:264 start_codon:yes stop_codon:yes gene_type:complete